MPVHTKNKTELLKNLDVDPLSGLSSEQAKQKLQKYGENKLKEKKKKTLPKRFFNQFKDIMILILIAAAIISFTVALNEHKSSEFAEPVIILLIVIINAVLGVVQESKAEKALEALQKLSVPKARVRRDSTDKVINAKEVVPGDIILVEAGDFVPADARLIDSVNLKCGESALTGESMPAEKNASAEVKENTPLGDRKNMIYTGCSVTYGRGSAVVTSTGMDTEMGTIADMLTDTNKEQTPLQKRLAKLGKYIGISAILICAVIFVIGLLNGIQLMEIFMTSVSLAVSAIPEGLPAIVTIVLAIGVQKMVKRNAIIRRLPAVETLGSATVICSDKTGTLTQNQMTLTKAYDAENDILEDISAHNENNIKKLLMYGTLCCDGNVIIENENEQHIGDPTETSIVLAAYKNGMPKDKLNKKYPRVAELPFDSDRKLMTVVNKMGDSNIVIVKGAFDMLACKCIKGDINKAKSLVDKLSSDALRIIAIAYKNINYIPIDPTTDELESDLTFMGFVGMIDPPRPEAKKAVQLCRQAGIKPIMITGDHIITASAIARELEIQLDGDKAITGTELAQMNDEDLNEEVKNISVYARVSPEDKIRIVKAWQKQGEVVSMTGDGVNDAPALKKADIGCAMGITGTDVAKAAADMTIVDDNFVTVVDAVKEGRGIYDNIKKAVAFLLGTNIGEVLTVFFGMLFWEVSPLISIQLLWINLVTDGFPAIALGMEKVDDNIMNQKPHSKNEGIFSHGLGLRIVLQGIMFGVLTLLGFKLGLKVTNNLGGARTMSFIILSMTQIIHSFNMRSDKSLLDVGFFTNRYLNGAALISILLVVLVVFIPPIATLFGLSQLPWYLYLIALGLAMVPILALELSKSSGLIKHQK